ncbi:MAG: Mur ligase family protein, partial [Microthrixaceae bacterium]
MRFLISELAAQLDGRVIGGAENQSLANTPAVESVELEVNGLAIDSRLVIPQQLFAAISAERDGHAYLPAAFAAGASAVLIEDARSYEALTRDESLTGNSGVAGPGILVADVSAALMQIAKIARRRIPDRVIGITGSVGKTTTKDLLAAVLAQRFVTVASEKSFNNELGVPLTLANAGEATEAAVVEMGARGSGHIALLCDLAQPTVGIVTTVERVHTQVMGNIEQIAQAKGELIAALPANGLAVLNAEVPLVAAMAERSEARVLCFGVGGDVQALHVQIDDELRPSFELHTPWGQIEVR